MEYKCSLNQTKKQSLSQINEKIVGTTPIQDNELFEKKYLIFLSLLSNSLSFNGTNASLTEIFQNLLGNPLFQEEEIAGFLSSPQIQAINDFINSAEMIQQSVSRDALEIILNYINHFGSSDDAIAKILIHLLPIFCSALVDNVEVPLILTILSSFLDTSFEGSMWISDNNASHIFIRFISPENPPPIQKLAFQILQSCINDTSLCNEGFQTSLSEYFQSPLLPDVFSEAMKFLFQYSSFADCSFLVPIILQLFDFSIFLQRYHRFSNRFPSPQLFLEASSALVRSSKFAIPEFFKLDTIELMNSFLKLFNKKEPQSDGQGIIPFFEMLFSFDDIFTLVIDILCHFPVISSSNSCKVIAENLIKHIETYPQILSFYTELVQRQSIVGFYIVKMIDLKPLIHLLNTENPKQIMQVVSYLKVAFNLSPPFNPNDVLFIPRKMKRILSEMEFSIVQEIIQLFMIIISKSDSEIKKKFLTPEIAQYLANFDADQGEMSVVAHNILCTIYPYLDREEPNEAEIIEIIENMMDEQNEEEI